MNNDHLKNAEFFQKNGYIYIENILDKEICSITTLYVLLKEEQKFLKSQKQESAAVYSDFLTESILFHLKDSMEINTGIELYPTCSYYRVYKNQNELFPHKDRLSCEISATVFLGYDYKDKEYSWPIMVNDEKIHMSVGSAVIYKGTEIEHSRDKFDINDPDAFHLQSFLHYVDKNGPYAEWKFDKRLGLGHDRTWSHFRKQKVNGI